MMRIENIPLAVINRALEIYGEPTETDRQKALTALASAECRIDIKQPRLADGTPIGALAQAMAEYMSLSGPWDEERGEHAGESGYEIT